MITTNSYSDEWELIIYTQSLDYQSENNYYLGGWY